MFQDVHVMTFIGFGLLLTQLEGNANNSEANVVTLYFTVAAICIQWAVLCCGFFHTDESGIIRLSMHRSLFN